MEALKASRQIEEQVKEGFAAVDKRFHKVADRFEKTPTREEMNEGFAGLRSEMNAGFAAQRSDSAALKRALIAGAIAIIAAIVSGSAAIVAALIGFVA